MRRVPVLALLACLASVAVAACGQGAPNAATAPPLDTPDPRSTVAGATGFPDSSTQPSALASRDVPAPSAYATGIDGALLYLQSYENDLIGGRYQAAWSLLAPSYQATFGTYDAFENDRTAFMAIAGRTYNVTANPTNVAPLPQLLKDKPFASEIDPKRAVVLTVQWPTLVRQGASDEVWVVSPGGNAGWVLYRIS